MGWNPPTRYNMLQAQQRLSWEPGRTLLSAYVWERICSKGGFFAFVRSWHWETQQPAFPQWQIELCSLWRHEWELCSAAALPGRSWRCLFPRPGDFVTLKTPWEINHTHLVFEGFGEQVRQMCHRWPFGDGMGLGDLSDFFSPCFLQLCNLSFEESLVPVSNPK